MIYIHRFVKVLLVFAILLIFSRIFVDLASTEVHKNTLVVMKYWDYHHVKPVPMIGTSEGCFQCPFEAVEIGKRYDIMTRGWKRVNIRWHRYPRVVHVVEWIER